VDLKFWKFIRTGCQLPHTHANEQTPFKLVEVKSNILGESGATDINYKNMCVIVFGQVTIQRSNSYPVTD